MAQTDITLRAGEASPTDVKLYATGTAAESAPILVYLCQTATQPSASEISLTLRAGEASSTDIRLYSSSYTAASQDTDVILRPVGLPCGTVTSSAALTAVESADAFAGTVEVITVAASDLAIAALESSDTFAGTLAGVGSVVSAPVGGGSAKRPRRRHFVIGDKHVIVDDRTELEAVIAMLAATPKPAVEPAKVVRKREPVPAAEVAPIEVAPVEFVPMRIDWAALDVLLRQSIRLEQPEVASVIREMMRRIEDDEDDVEALLLT